MEGNNTSESDPHSNVWECHICMQLPTDPVATSCGHIFCWPCIYQWLRNGPKPCPVCRVHLHKDRNILPLYGVGARAGGPTLGNGDGDDDNSNGDGNNNNSEGDGNDDGNDDGSAAVETAASADDDHVIPPRPRNSLLQLFGAGASTARLEPAGSESSAHEAAEDSQLSLSRDPALEILLQERVALEVRVNDLEQRISNQRRAAQDSAIRYLEETIERVQHIGRLRRQIVRKDRLLSRANHLLPRGWYDGVL